MKTISRREINIVVILFAHDVKTRQFLYHNNYSLSPNNKIIFRRAVNLELLLPKLKNLKLPHYKTAQVWVLRYPRSHLGEAATSHAHLLSPGACNSCPLASLFPNWPGVFRADSCGSLSRECSNSLLPTLPTMLPLALSPPKEGL